MSELLDMFQYAFMQRAFLAGVVLGLAIPLVGVVVVLKRLSMIGDALSHASLAGVAAGLVGGINPVAGATVACVTAAFCVEGVRKRLVGHADLAIAVITAAGVGLAGVLSGFVPNSSTLSSFLFGSIVTVDDGELAGVVVVGFLVVAFCLLCNRELFWVTLDERAARLAGVRVRLVNAVFVLVCALAVAVASRTVGTLIVSAMMTVPVACALVMARSWRQTCVWASAVGVVSAAVGLAVSYLLGLKPGGTIVLIEIAVLLVLLAVRGVRAACVRRRPSLAVTDAGEAGK